MSWELVGTELCAMGDKACIAPFLLLRNVRPFWESRYMPSVNLEVNTVKCQRTRKYPQIPVTWRGLDCTGQAS